MLNFRFSLITVMILAAVGPARSEPKQIDSACDKPVIMLVLANIDHPELMQDYYKQFPKSIYPEQQGYYQFTKPTEVFEGQWPEQQFTIGVKFPCVEAARGFMYSDDYQRIRHLRSGAGTLSISVHPISEPPAYITGMAPKRLFEQQEPQENP